VYTATLYVKQLLLPAAIGDEMELQFYLIPDSSSSLTYTTVVYAFLSSDDGRQDCPKHVERFTRIKNLR
jgi:hypothetical protein